MLLRNDTGNAASNRTFGEGDPVPRRPPLLFPFVLGAAGGVAFVIIRGRQNSFSDFSGAVAALRTLRLRMREAVPVEELPALGVEPEEDSRVEIARVTATYLDALLQGNPVTYVSTYLDDALVVPGLGPIVRGHAAIAETIEARFAEVRFVEAEKSTIDLQLSGDSAIETGHYRYLVRSFPGSTPQTLVGRYIILWKRASSRWSIALDIAQPGATAG
jgi:uncharacterized protein (TIGR02246 family)